MANFEHSHVPVSSSAHPTCTGMFCALPDDIAAGLQRLSAAVGSWRGGGGGGLASR